MSDGFVRITNQSRGSTLASRGRMARSAVERTRGLLGTSSLPSGGGLYIEKAPSIHMFFMRYPIDAVFVDRHRKVVKVVENLRPWRAVLWAPGAADCLELPAGAIAASGTRVGDQLAISGG